MRENFYQFIVPDIEKEMEFFDDFFALKVDNFKNIYKDSLNLSKEQAAEKKVIDCRKFLINNNFVDVDMVITDYEMFKIPCEYINIINYIYIKSKEKHEESENGEQGESLRSYIEMNLSSKEKQEMLNFGYGNYAEDKYRRICHIYKTIFSNDVLSRFFDWERTEYQYSFYDKYSMLFRAMCMNSNKSPYKDSLSLEECRNTEECIKKLDLKSYKKDFASIAYLRTFMNAVNEQEKQGIDVKFVSEIMLNTRTVVYLTKKICEKEQETHYFDDTKLYEIFSAMLYVFIYPNIFGRKGLIDEILKKSDDWIYNLAFGFHEEVTDEIWDEALKDHESDRGIYTEQIKQAILSFSFTSLPIIRAYSYSVIKEEDLSEKIKDIVNIYEEQNIIEKIYDSENSDQWINPIELVKTKREKEIFCKIYRFLKMKLYNKTVLMRWITALYPDIRMNNDFKRILQSMLEYERVKAFDGDVSDEYIVKIKQLKQR